MMTRPNHALQRTRRERLGCHRGVPLVLLGNCDRTISTRWTPVKRVYRLLKPYPAHPERFGEHLRKHRLDSRLTHVAIAAFLGFHPFAAARSPTAP